MKFKVSKHIFADAVLRWMTNPAFLTTDFIELELEPIEEKHDPFWCNFHICQSPTPKKIEKLLYSSDISLLNKRLCDKINEILTYLESL